MRVQFSAILNPVWDLHPKGNGKRRARPQVQGWREPTDQQAWSAFAYTHYAQRQNDPAALAAETLDGRWYAVTGPDALALEKLYADDTRWHALAESHENATKTLVDWNTRQKEKPLLAAQEATSRLRSAHRQVARPIEQQMERMHALNETEISLILEKLDDMVRLGQELAKAEADLIRLKLEAHRETRRLEALEKQAETATTDYKQQITQDFLAGKPIHEVPYWYNLIEDVKKPPINLDQWIPPAPGPLKAWLGKLMSRLRRPQP